MGRLRPCIICGKITEKTYCDECWTRKLNYSKVAKDIRLAESRQWKKLYNKRAWRNERIKFITRNPLCCVCGRPATQIDHIKPHKGDERLFFDQSNWQSICRQCHGEKTMLHDIQGYSMNDTVKIINERSKYPREIRHLASGSKWAKTKVEFLVTHDLCICGSDSKHIVHKNVPLDAEAFFNLKNLEALCDECYSKR